MKTIDTLVEDIHGLFKEGQRFNTDLFKEFGQNVHDLMESRFHTERGGERRLRMSNVGRPDRQLWYDINAEGTRETISPTTMIKFAYGDLIEQMVLLYAKMAGHIVEREQEEVELDGIPGHIDAVIDGCCVDVKSASSYSFAKFQSGSLFTPGNDPFGYVAQLCGYREALGVERCGFLVVDKTLGKLCFCEIPKEIIDEYGVRDRIRHVKVVVGSPTLPSRCYDDVEDGKSGNRKLDTGCSYCSWKEQCWADANDGEGLRLYRYSTGPRWLTKVIREPKIGFND